MPIPSSSTSRSLLSHHHLPLLIKHLQPSPPWDFLLLLLFLSLSLSLLSWLVLMTGSIEIQDAIDPSSYSPRTYSQQPIPNRRMPSTYSISSIGTILLLPRTPRPLRSNLHPSLSLLPQFLLFLKLAPWFRSNFTHPPIISPSQVNLPRSSTNPQGPLLTPLLLPSNHRHPKKDRRQESKPIIKLPKYSILIPSNDHSSTHQNPFWILSSPVIQVIQGTPKLAWIPAITHPERALVHRSSDRSVPNNWLIHIRFWVWEWEVLDEHGWRWKFENSWCGRIGSVPVLGIRQLTCKWTYHAMSSGNWRTNDLGLCSGVWIIHTMYLPASVDHVLQDPADHPLAFMGHSQPNTTTLFSLEKGVIPRLGSKLSWSIVLAPTLYAAPLTSAFPFSRLHIQSKTGTVMGSKVSSASTISVDRFLLFYLTPPPPPFSLQDGWGGTISVMWLRQLACWFFFFFYHRSSMIWSSGESNESRDSPRFDQVD